MRRRPRTSGGAFSWEACASQRWKEQRGRDSGGEQPWNESVRNAMLVEAYDALAKGGWQELDKITGLTARSAHAFLSLGSQFLDCLSQRVEQERIDWASVVDAKHVW